VIGQDPSAWTAQIALSTFLTSQSINLPGLFAGAVVTIVPLALMFLVAHRSGHHGHRPEGLTPPRPLRSLHRPIPPR
jgi:multiple sugar transport system permease protein